MTGFGDSIGAARLWLADQLVKGVQCPVCDQHVQHYRWSLYRGAIGMLAQLGAHQRANGPTYIHSRLVKRAGQGGDGTRLALWGLAEWEPHPRRDGGKTANMRITDEGRRFLAGQIAVPRYAWTFNGEWLRFEGELIRVRDIVGDFDYQEYVLGGQQMRLEA